MLDPALREIIVTSAWKHLPMTVGDNEMPGFQIYCQWSVKLEARNRGTSDLQANLE